MDATEIDHTVRVLLALWVCATTGFLGGVAAGSDQYLKHASQGPLAILGHGIIGLAMAILVFCVWLIAMAATDMPLPDMMIHGAAIGTASGVIHVMLLRLVNGVATAYLNKLGIDWQVTMRKGHEERRRRNEGNQADG